MLKLERFDAVLLDISLYASRLDAIRWYRIAQVIGAMTDKPCSSPIVRPVTTRGENLPEFPCLLKLVFKPGWPA